MGVKYLKPGQDFYFPADFGFKEGATPAPSDDNSTYVGRQRFAKGGHAKKEQKADGGQAEGASDTPMRQSRPDKPPRSRTPDKPMPERLGDLGPDEQQNFWAEHGSGKLNDDEAFYHSTNPAGRLGGQYARGGEAAPPQAAPHQQSAANHGEPTISMPLSQAAKTAAHLMQVGAQHGATQAVQHIAGGIAARRQAEAAGPPQGAPPMGGPPMPPPRPPMAGPPGGAPMAPPPRPQGAPPMGAPPMGPPKPPMGAPPGGPPMMAEGGHWIQQTHMHKGALHRDLGVPQGQPIPAGKLERAAHSSNPKERRRAEFAETLRGLPHKGK